MTKELRRQFYRVMKQGANADSADVEALEQELADSEERLEDIIADAQLELEETTYMLMRLAKETSTSPERSRKR